MVICSLLLLAGWLIQPTAAQFGVAGRHKKQAGTTFEEVNEMAKQQSEGGEVPGLDDSFGLLGDMFNMDAAGLESMLQGAMDNPELKKLMEELGGGDPDALSKQMAEAMQLLSDPEKLAKEMQAAMDTLSSEGGLDALLSDQDELLSQMEKTGLLTDEMLDNYRKNPDLIAEDLKTAMGQMKDLYSNPETMKAFEELLSDPMKALEGLGLSESDFKNFFEDDTKIEEARLQILGSGSLGENEALASLFGSDEDFKEILNDPVKWRENVKKGQEMAFGGQAGVGVEL